LGEDLVTNVQPAGQWVEQPARTTRRRVLVALSGPEAPHLAIEAGRVVARALGVPLHGVLAWPTPISPCEVPRLLEVEPSTLEGMVIDVHVGDPAESISAATRAHAVAFVVLVGEREGRDACGVGELAARMLAQSFASAILLRPGTSLQNVRRIMVPIDGTPSIATALGPAGELAQRTGAALDVIMVEDSRAPLPVEHGAMAPPRYVDQPQHEWPAFSAELLERLLGVIARFPPGIPTRLLLGTGEPASEILRFARELEPDLVAMVWRTAGWGEGCVFREVLRHATQPVLVLRQ
jgi:nucleotide-binding universal stress UspA family protein